MDFRPDALTPDEQAAYAARLRTAQTVADVVAALKAQDDPADALIDDVLEGAMAWAKQVLTP